MTDEFKAQRREIEAFLKNRKLTQALGLMCKLAEKLKSKAIVERINKLQDDYRLMLRYVIDGVDDPNREALYNGFVNRSYMLLDSLTRRHLTPDTPTLYFSMVRFEAMRPDDNVAALVKRYMKLTDETSLFNLISNEDGDDAKHSVTETEVLERRLFNRLWVTFPLVGDNYDAVERLLKSDAVPAHVKQLVMSSLLMGLLEFYDESRLSLLLDVYNNTAGDAASPLPAVALTAAVLTMLTHSNRIPGEAVRGRLDLAAAKPTWKSDLRMVYIELVKTRDTERINRKMTDELIPELMKLRPDISKHQLDISQLTDITEIAKAAADAGADALSLINTLRGMRIDVNTRRPILKMNTGGLSGPAVLPVAVRMVWEVASAVKLPILGMGGVSTGEDAAQLMLAGASAVAVGTALFADPCAPLKVRDGLADVAARQGLSAVRELTGGVRPW